MVDKPKPTNLDIDDILGTLNEVMHIADDVAHSPVNNGHASVRHTVHEESMPGLPRAFEGLGSSSAYGSGQVTPIRRNSLLRKGSATNLNEVLDDFDETIKTMTLGRNGMFKSNSGASSGERHPGRPSKADIPRKALPNVPSNVSSSSSSSNASGGRSRSNTMQNSMSLNLPSSASNPENSMSNSLKSVSKDRTPHVAPTPVATVQAVLVSEQIKLIEEKMKTKPKAVNTFSIDLNPKELKALDKYAERRRTEIPLNSTTPARFETAPASAEKSNPKGGIIKGAIRDFKRKSSNFMEVFKQYHNSNTGSNSKSSVREDDESPPTATLAPQAQSEHPVRKSHETKREHSFQTVQHNNHGNQPSLSASVPIRAFLRESPDHSGNISRSDSVDGPLASIAEEHDKNLAIIMEANQIISKELWLNPIKRAHNDWEACGRWLDLNFKVSQIEEDSLLIDSSCCSLGFFLEIGTAIVGVKSAKIKKPHSSDDFLDIFHSKLIELEDSDQERAFFHHFYKKEHDIWTAQEEILGPIVLIIERLVSKSQTYLKVICWTKRKSLRLALPSDCETSDDKIKMFKRLALEFAKVKFSMVKEASRPAASELVLELENKLQVTKYKFGILYAKKDQTTEDEFFNNVDMSPEFEEFLEIIGEKVELKNFEGYAGGLDTKNDTTGTHSLHTQFKGFEIMFHVATFLPFFPKDKQQVERKRHLGNDIVIIVFKEGDTKFSPPTITSHFNHVFVVVSVDKDHPGCYRIEIANKFGVKPNFPYLPCPPLLIKKEKEKCKEFLLTKLINSERSALNAPDFRPLIRTKETLLNQMVKNLSSASSQGPSMNLLRKMPWGASERKTVLSASIDESKKTKKPTKSASKTSSEKSSTPATPNYSRTTLDTITPSPKGTIPSLQVTPSEDESLKATATTNTPVSMSVSASVNTDRSPSLGHEGERKDSRGDRRSKTIDASEVQKDFATMYKKLEF